MSKKELSTSVWSGEFNIMGVVVKCHTLSDGQRVIEAESVENLLRILEDGPGDSPFDAADISRFASWRAGSLEGGT